MVRIGRGSSRPGPSRGTALAAALAWLACAHAAFAQPCVVPDNGSGTVNLPPPGCGYVSPTDLHMIIDGLPPGTTINIGVQHSDFFNVSQVPGGTLGGDRETFQSFLFMQLQGTGVLAGFNRNVNMQVACETHVGPRTLGTSPQSFDTAMYLMQGQIVGDPDFDLLRVTAGTGFGMPSPGHTTLTRLTGGDWNVDSFFDITYRIDFVGRPGSVLGGMSGSTTGTIRMHTGRPMPVPDPCTVADDGSGTVRLPPDGCGYVSPDDLHMMIAGLPAGTTIVVGAEHSRFFGVTTTPGGTLGGEVETFSSSAVLRLHGTGDLAGFQRLIDLPLGCETHTGPRTPGNPVQSFDTDMFMMQGQLPPGDPDFDLLRITAGTGFGMPSPGHTTLAQQPTGEWAVDSFFDITYRIDFVGAPGGPLGGMSGSTTGTIRMQAGTPSATDVGDPGLEAPPRATELLQNAPNPFNPATTISFDLAQAGRVKLVVLDVTGRVVRTLVDAQLPANRYAFLWNGKDDQGQQAASGTYFYVLEAPDGRHSKSMVLLK